MKLRSKTTPGNGETEIRFPLLECWNPLTKVATIAAEVNRERVPCRIAFSDLEARFGATEDQPMQAVVDNRAILERGARRRLEAKAFEEDGSILLRAEDLLAD